MQALSFPRMGINLELNRVAFQIGSISIYWYGILIALGFLAGLIFVMSNAKKFGLDADRVIDVILGGTIGAIICARLYFVIFSWDLYKDNLWKIFDTREGGIAIYGSLIGAFVFGILVARWRKVAILPICDLAAGGFLIGQAIGRWGNFVNIEAFGSNTNLPWGMSSPAISRYLESLRNSGIENIDPALPVHPTFLYESLWCFIGFAIILLYKNRRKFDGEIFLFYTAWYGFGRMLIEGLRTDSLMLGNFRVSQVLGGVLFVLATIAWLVIRSKIKKAADPNYLKLYVNTEEGQLVVAGEFYKKAAKNDTASEKSPDTALPDPEDGEMPDQSDEAQEAADPPEETEAAIQEEDADGKDH